MTSWLTEMLALKRRFASSIMTCSGEDKLNNVVLDQNLNETEQMLLKQLFEQA